MKHPSKPKEWPVNEKWPPTRNIVQIIETYPPVFVLEDGKKIKGVGSDHEPNKKSTKVSVSLHPPSKNPYLVKDKKAIYKSSDGFHYIIKQSLFNRTTGIPSRVGWQIIIDKHVIDAIKHSFRVNDLNKIYFIISGSRAPKVKKDMLVHHILQYIQKHRRLLPVHKGTRL